MTWLLSHHPHSAPHPQSRWQRHRRRGRVSARCCSQGDADHRSKVRHCPRVFAFMSAPIDMAHHLPPNPTLAVSSTTSSVLKEEPRLQRASRATRRCNRLSKSPASRTSPRESSRLCQRPLTLLSTCFLTRTRRLGYNDLGAGGAAALAEGLKGNSTLLVLE